MIIVIPKVQLSIFIFIYLPMTYRKTFVGSKGPSVPRVIKKKKDESLEGASRKERDLED
jgi:hypothetical protein